MFYIIYLIKKYGNIIFFFNMKIYIDEWNIKNITYKWHSWGHLFIVINASIIIVVSVIIH